MLFMDSTRSWINDRKWDPPTTCLIFVRTLLNSNVLLTIHEYVPVWTNCHIWCFDFLLKRGPPIVALSSTNVFLYQMVTFWEKSCNHKSARHDGRRTVFQSIWFPTKEIWNVV